MISMLYGHLEKKSPVIVVIFLLRDVVDEGTDVSGLCSHSSDIIHSFPISHKQPTTTPSLDPSDKGGLDIDGTDADISWLDLENVVGLP